VPVLECDPPSAAANFSAVQSASSTHVPTLSRTVAMLADLEARSCSMGARPGPDAAALGALRRYASEVVTRVELSRESAESLDWIDRAPESPGDPGMHIVSRVGLCRHDAGAMRMVAPM
jgi:hypothetical protein